MVPDFITLLRTAIFKTENLSPSEAKTSYHEMVPDFGKELITPHLPSTDFPEDHTAVNTANKRHGFLNPKPVMSPHQDLRGDSCG